MARPAESPEGHHARRMTIRFTEDQFESIEGEALNVGVTPSAYVRQLALSRDVTIEHPVVLDASDIRPAVVQLARIGNNLNQIAHWLNWHDTMDEGLRRQTTETLVQIREAARELTTLAGGKLPKRRG